MKKQCSSSFTAIYSSRGFTLLETMIVIAVLAILIGLAAPSFSDLFSRNRLTNVSNDIVVTLNATRQVAISRGLTTFACHSQNADTDNPTCGGGSNWNNGVLIYASAPNRFNPDLRDFISGGGSPDSLVRQEAFINTDVVEITATNAANQLAFTADGILLGNNEITFQICDSGRTGEEGSVIRVSATGRISSGPAEGGDACT